MHKIYFSSWGRETYSLCKRLVNGKHQDRYSEDKNYCKETFNSSAPTDVFSTCFWDNLVQKFYWLDSIHINIILAWETDYVFLCQPLLFPRFQGYVRANISLVTKSWWRPARKIYLRIISPSSSPPVLIIVMFWWKIPSWNKKNIQIFVFYILCESIWNTCIYI